MKELGNWLMDIAKYMATALLLSSAFGEMDRPWVVIAVIVGTLLTLGGGLWLVIKYKNNNKEE